MLYRFVLLQITHKIMRALKIILIVLAVLGLGVFLFLKFADKDTKRKIFEDMGIQDSEFVEEEAIETFIATTEITARQKINGVWVISGWIRNTHKSKTINSVTIRFNFSDGSSTERFIKTLNPDGLGQPFRVKIDGHENGEFLNYDIIEAD